MYEYVHTSDKDELVVNVPVVVVVDCLVLPVIFDVELSRTDDIKVDMFAWITSASKNHTSRYSEGHGHEIKDYTSTRTL